MEIVPSTHDESNHFHHKKPIQLGRQKIQIVHANPTLQDDKKVKCMDEGNNHPGQLQSLKRFAGSGIIERGPKHKTLHLPKDGTTGYFDIYDAIREIIYSVLPKITLKKENGLETILPHNRFIEKGKKAVAQGTITDWTSHEDCGAGKLDLRDRIQDEIRTAKSDISEQELQFYTDEVVGRIPSTIVDQHVQNFSKLMAKVTNCPQHTHISLKEMSRGHSHTAHTTYIHASTHPIDLNEHGLESGFVISPYAIGIEGVIKSTLLSMKIVMGDSPTSHQSHNIVIIRNSDNPRFSSDKEDKLTSRLRESAYNKHFNIGHIIQTS